MSPITDSETGTSMEAEDPLSRRLTSSRQEDGAFLSRAIARAKQGDLSAVHLLYVRYADDVLACVQNMVRNRGQAEAVTHAVFAELTTVIGRYRRPAWNGERPR